MGTKKSHMNFSYVMVALVTFAVAPATALTLLTHDLRDKGIQWSHTVRNGRRSTRRPLCGIRRLAYATRIVGGRAAPWAARYNAAIFSGSRRCSGSVVAARWVLTAAHCRLRKGDVVYVGGASAKDGGRRIISAIHRHPCFRRSRHSVICDIALVRLNRIIGRDASPILLNADVYSPHEGAIVRVTGYGRDMFRVRGRLRAIDIDNVSLNDCRRAFIGARMNAIAAGLSVRHHICANHFSCGASVCFGDSGGPLISRDKSGSLIQIGVTSYGGPRCGSRTVPDVYARVAFFRPWIQRITRNSVKFKKLRAV